jgi:hypothetical protein
MGNMDRNKADDTADARNKTEKIWNEIIVGDVVELKHVMKISGEKTGNKIAKVTEKYKVINKQHMSILFKKVKNGMKETFTFADFLTGDVTI